MSEDTTLDFSDFLSDAKPSVLPSAPKAFKRDWPLRRWSGLGLHEGKGRCHACGFTAMGSIRTTGPGAANMRCEPCFAHETIAAATTWGCTHVWIPEVTQEHLVHVVRTAQLIHYLSPNTRAGVDAEDLLRSYQKRGQSLRNAIDGMEWHEAVGRMSADFLAEFSSGVRTICMPASTREMQSWIEYGGTFGGFKVERSVR